MMIVSPTQTPRSSSSTVTPNRADEYSPLTMTNRQILCGRTWYWDWATNSHIILNPDGTGELTCTSGGTVFIAVELNWAPRSAIDMPTTAGFFSTDDPITLGKCKIGIVLSKRPVVNSGYFAIGDSTWSDGLLFDNAFKERQFTITFDQGSFVSGADIKWKKVKDLWDAPRFRYRMTMDPSPYPARKDWVDPTSVEALGFWNWNVFCAEKDDLFVPKREKKKKKKKSFVAKLGGFLMRMKF